MALDVAIGLVIIGACILAAVLVLAGRSIAKQPSGRPRHSWIALTGLMLLFSVGYIGYATVRWDGNTRLSDLGVPLVLFGACLVLAVSALALASAQDVRRLTLLEHENITDSLTGIPNYSYFAARLNEEVARSNRYQLPLALIMVDVDHFKTINDTFGHLAGDAVLRELAELLAQSSRGGDVVARVGGEEFIVLLPGADNETAGVVAERVLNTVRAHAFRTMRGQQQITVSIGIACEHVRDGHIGGALRARADEALYVAKRLGRNRVVMWAPGIRSNATPPFNIAVAAD